MLKLTYIGLACSMYDSSREAIQTFQIFTLYMFSALGTGSTELARHLLDKPALLAYEPVNQSQHPLILSPW
jgi:hypothetical protein